MTCGLGAALDCVGCVDQSVSCEGVCKTITSSGSLFQVLRVVNDEELWDLKPLCHCLPRESSSSFVFYAKRAYMPLKKTAHVSCALQTRKGINFCEGFTLFLPQVH